MLHQRGGVRLDDITYRGPFKLVSFLLFMFKVFLQSSESSLSTTFLSFNSFCNPMKQLLNFFWYSLLIFQLPKPASTILRSETFKNQNIWCKIGLMVTKTKIPFSPVKILIQPEVWYDPVPFAVLVWWLQSLPSPKIIFTTTRNDYWVENQVAGLKARWGNLKLHLLSCSQRCEFPLVIAFLMSEKKWNHSVPSFPQLCFLSICILPFVNGKVNLRRKETHLFMETLCWLRFTH